MDNYELYKNLRAFETASFPKACDNCKTCYENEQEFIERTTTYQDAPKVKASIDEKGKTYLKLARKCRCGKAFIDHFGDRRDASAQGELRRQAFEKVIQNLIKRGLSRVQARMELLNHLNNKKSALLEDLGIFNR